MENLTNHKDIIDKVEEVEQLIKIPICSELIHHVKRIDVFNVI
jgi:hypothetical protein